MNPGPRCRFRWEARCTSDRHGSKIGKSLERLPMIEHLCHKFRRHKDVHRAKCGREHDGQLTYAGFYNTLKLTLMLALAFLAACSCDATVVELDGGTHCGEECATSSDCPSGWHCSLHPWDPKGICFHNPRSFR